MTSVWRHLGDNLKNVTILMAIMFGVAIPFGNYVYNFLLLTLPASWLVLGNFSIPIYLGIIGAITGYFLDKY